MPQQYMERKKKKRPQDTSVSKAVTDIQSYLFIHMILAGPFFLGPLRCYFHGLGKKTKSPSLNHIQPTEHTSITQKPGFTTGFLLRFDPSSVKSEGKGLWKLSWWTKMMLNPESSEVTQKRHHHRCFLSSQPRPRLTFERYASMFSDVIDGSVTNSKSSRTVITATPCLRKKSAKEDACEGSVREKVAIPTSSQTDR